MSSFRDMMRRRRVNEYVCVSVLLVVLLCGFFWKVVLLRHCFTAADMLFMVDPWKAYKPPDLVVPQNKVHCDEVAAFYPWRTFTVEMVRKGEIPLWNPYVMLGAPHLANYQSTVFDPLCAVFYFMPIKTALGVSAMMKLFLCGLFAFAFARTLGLSRAAAALCAVTYAFCGYNVAWLKWPLASAMVWLPAMLICVERMLAARKMGWTLLLGIVVGLLFFSGHPESIFTILLGVAMYTVVRSVQYARQSGVPRQGVNLAVCVALAVLIGVGVAAVQLVPFAEFARNSWTVAERAEEEAALSTYHLPMLVQFFVPNFYGSSADQNYWGYRNSNIDASLYVGVPALILFVMALVLLKKAPRELRHPSIALLITAVVCTATGFRIFPFSLTEKLPLFNQLRYEYFVAFNCIALPALGAVGLHLFVQAEPRDRIRSLLAGLLLFVLALLISLFLLRWFRGMIRILKIERYESIQMAKFLAWSLIALALLTLFHKFRLPAWFLSAGLVCVTVADLFTFSITFNPTLEPQHMFPDTKLFSRLREDKSLYRVWCMASPVPSSTLMVYGIADHWGYDGIYYYRSMVFPGQLKKLFWEKFSGLLNVKYFLQGPFEAGEIDFWNMPMFRLVDTLDNVSVFENLTMLPRALVVHRATVAESEDKLFDVLRSDGFDPATAVVLEKPVPEEVMALLDDAPATDGSAATVREYEPHSVTIDADMEHAGFVILPDTYYPGWKVFVDNEEKELYAADYIARAVFVTKGAHVVRFVYAPLSFKVGVWLSFLTAALVAVAAIVDRSRRNRGNAAASP